MTVQHILAIDPGTTRSGLVVVERGLVEVAAKVDNEIALNYARSYSNGSALETSIVCIERFEARGMPMSDDSVETVLFTGQLIEAVTCTKFAQLALLKRSKIKIALCGTARAKDANVRAALIDIWGDSIRKRKKDGTLSENQFTIVSDAWAALAVATVYMQEHNIEKALEQ